MRFMNEKKSADLQSDEEWRVRLCGVEKNVTSPSVGSAAKCTTNTNRTTVPLAAKPLYCKILN